MKRRDSHSLVKGVDKKGWERFFKKINISGSWAAVKKQTVDTSVQKMHSNSNSAMNEMSDIQEISSLKSLSSLSVCE